MPAPRRSLRTRTTTAASSLDNPQEVDEVSDGGDVYVQPEKTERKKRARRTASDAEPVKDPERKRRRRKGKLARLPEMPIDVLFEIFTHLLPYDLLRLSRSAKSLRNLLMNRSSRFIWSEALTQVPDLPPCPADLTEPGYVRLCFEPVCHFCGTPQVRDVLWALRVRACKSCFSRQVDSSDSEGDWTTSLFVRHNQFCGTVLDDAVILTVAWQMVLTKGSFGASYLSIIRTTLKFYVDSSPGDMYCLVEAIRSTQDSFLNSTWPDDTSLKTYLEKRQAAAEAIEEHGRECAEWMEIVRVDRSEEIETTKTRRMEAIFDKLRDLGFMKEISWMCTDGMYPWGNSFQDHKLVKQAKDLTPRIWNNIKDTLTEVMVEVREAMQYEHVVLCLVGRGRALREDLKIYAKNRPQSEVIPSDADLYMLEPFRTVFDAPLPEEFWTERVNFEAAIDQLPTLSKQWRDSCLLSLLPMLPHSDISLRSNTEHGSVNAAQELAPLKLATSLFTCQYRMCPDFHQDRVFTAQNLLAHPCMNKTLVYTDGDGTRSPYHRAMECAPWNCGGKRIAFHADASALAAQLVKSCDLDLATATTTDMDEFGARFQCHDCPEPEGTLAMDWRGAIEHLMIESPKCEWLSRLPRVEEDELRVRESNAGVEVFVEAGHTRKFPRAWTCALCRESGMSIPGLETHIRNEHDGLPALREHYWPDLDRFAPATGDFWVHPEGQGY